MSYKPSPEEMVCQVVATLAIENMPVDTKFRSELLKVARKEKTSAELIAELDDKY